jgi:predicted nucleic acid-binding protein
MECLTNVDRLAAQIETNADLVPARQALNIARSFRLSAYDGVYLNLARNESLPLATLDRSLRSAAERAAVELFQ